LFEMFALAQCSRPKYGIDRRYATDTEDGQCECDKASSPPAMGRSSATSDDGLAQPIKAAAKEIAHRKAVTRRLGACGCARSWDEVGDAPRNARRRGRGDDNASTQDVLSYGKLAWGRLRKRKKSYARRALKPVPNGTGRNKSDAAVR